MQYYALSYGTAIQNDVYEQVTGLALELQVEVEDSDIILSGQEVPFDCYLDIDVAELSDLSDWLDADTSAPPTPGEQKA